MGRDPDYASPQDWFCALVYYVRGRAIASQIRTSRRTINAAAKIVYYLSLEVLPGRLLKANLLSLGLLDTCRRALASLDVDLDELWELEVEPPLGNGGLGRLAACMLDSLATQSYAAFGYGIRYEYGLFRQEIEEGQQVEHPENWLRTANPWEFARPNAVYPVGFNGHVVQFTDSRRRLVSRLVHTNDIQAMAYDLPVVGFGSDTTLAIRLWSAKATSDFNLSYFNEGNYIDAVKEKSKSETLSKILYPNDNNYMGRELRLRQEYFLVCASLKDILKRFLRTNDTLRALPDKVAIHLNDTHPALAVTELMRLLLDEHLMGWEEAWDITVRTCSFSNHTLLSEALEHWPVDMVGTLLPRHLQIIYEINHRFLRDVGHRHPGDDSILRRMSLIDETGARSVRMAHLAVVGSHKVNGVSPLHTKIVRESLFADFDAFYPGRIVNKTNGITPRRWLNQANPGLAGLISARIGDGWVTDLAKLEGLRRFAKDPDFQSAFRAVKQANRERLAERVRAVAGVDVDATSMFDVHIKRIHEYKRQLLNVLHVITRYNRIRHGQDTEAVPRTVIFAGKAAPGYAMAKLIIQLINAVADVVNNDPAIDDRLRVVFVPNYDVSTAEEIIPAADLSEQIPTAGTEAAGTGNMKLALNGALTIATADGANRDIAAAVGEDNIFLFGLRYDEVAELRRTRNHDPGRLYSVNPELREALEMIRSGYFLAQDRGRFAPIIDSLVRHGDPFLVLADYAAYIARQDDVDAAWRNPAAWTAKAILNVASMGSFSSDRMVREYASEIWNIERLPP
jgi:starch phosphorylase